MKKIINTSFYLLVILVLISCGQRIAEHLFDCNSLTDKKNIYEIAKSIINDGNNEHIWNLHDIDTTDFFTTEDYFTNPKTKNRLVLIGGNAGLSAGTATNLLILFSCSDTVIWAGQVGNLTEIADVNGDGIMEIIINTGSAWMGEINEWYEIFNFKDGKQNFLFTAHSKSVIDNDGDSDVFFNLPEYYKKGDTLENSFDCSLIKHNENEYGVKQIRTVKIHNGGQTEKEILKRMRVFTDTTIINLK
jgi:hypothetical protein